MSKTVAFMTLGCKVNSYETQAMEETFDQAGYKIVDFKDFAQVYVINTCTVTNLADRKSRQMINQARKRNPQAIIVAVGCYIQAADEKELKAMDVDVILGNNKKNNILSLVEENIATGDKKINKIDINKENNVEGGEIHGTKDKTRAFIRIQDGCNRFCSYCIIPYVRGPIRSREEGEILSEVKNLAENGFKEIVLTGIHIASYGLAPKDKQKESSNMPLLQLIKNISKIGGIKRVRLGSLEPGIITQEFAEQLSQIEEFCPHFHLSLQSGSPTVLKRMNRRYSPEEYYEKTEILRKFFENPSFTTDIIVGFPGESEDEFQETIAFANKIKFSKIHVFKYSMRSGTKAASMKNQISGLVKNQRSKKLINLGEKLSDEYMVSLSNQPEKVLVEEEVEIKGKKYLMGHNKRFIKLACEADGDDNHRNEIVNVQVKGKLSKDIMLSIKNIELFSEID